MKSYCLVIPTTDLPVKQDSLTFQLVLRPDFFQLEPTCLYFNELWVCIDDSVKRFLWAKLWIETMEEINYEDGQTGYVITADPLRSNYYMRLGDHRSSIFRVPTLLAAVPLNKVTFLSDKQTASLDATAERIPVKIAPPDDRLVGTLNIQSFPSKPLDRFRAVMRVLKRAYVVPELYRSGAYPQSWSAHEGFAYRYFEINYPAEAKLIRTALDSGHTCPSIQSERFPDKHCDLDLRPIDPDNIHTRRFLPPPEEGPGISLADFLHKTDRAEKDHQRILKDLSKRVISLGGVPLESNSIDLMVVGKKADLVVEIKSANADNLHRQCTSGAVQCKEYCYNLQVNEAKKRVALLVAMKAGGVSSLEYEKALLDYMGLTLLFYDETRMWPDRVLGFDHLVQGVCQIET